MVTIPKLEKKYRQASLKDVNDSKTWVLKKMSYLRQATAHGLMAFGQKFVTKPEIGKMYMYFYDAKTKDELEYWDKFPCMICVDYAKNGWYGLNLHYLPVRQRYVLLEQLMEFANNDKLDSTTRLKLSYELLKAAGHVQPCFKQYLFGHIRSKFLLIDPSEWHLAVSLPVQQFVKGGTGKNSGNKFWARRVWGNTGRSSSGGKPSGGGSPHKGHTKVATGRYVKEAKSR